MHQLSKSEALWREAYAIVRRREPDIIHEYEQALCPDLGKSTPADRLNGIVRQRLRDRDMKALVASLVGKPIKLREIGERVINFIWQSRDFIISVASTEPHVALVWSGVSLLLPVSLCFSLQSEISCLDKITYREKELIKVSTYTD